MWARVLEIVTGIWLLISPFLFSHDPHHQAPWISDFASAAAVIVLACLSFWRPTRYAHLLNLAVAAWLVGFGYLVGGHPAAPGFQNDIFTGLTLMIFAIIPNDATQPPPSWRRFYHEQAEANLRQQPRP